MGRFTEEHINFLKEMISKGKEKYQPEWEKIKKPLMDAMREFREKLFQIFKEESEEHIKKKTWEKEENKFYEIVRELKLGEIFIFAVDYDKETWEKIKNLFEEIKNLPPRKEEMYGILEKLVKNKNENKIAGSTTYWTILLSVFYPEWYFPADNNVLGEKIRNKINIQEFWGGAANPNTIKDGRELYNILYDIKQNLGIETMLELGFYLYKYAKEKPSLEPTGAQNKNTSLSSIINAINTKPFLILAGISGTGKTQIARLIAWAMSEENNNKKEG
jgi:ABC-type glutathione transport system ATPase component